MRVIPQGQHALASASSGCAIVVASSSPPSSLQSIVISSTSRTIYDWNRINLRSIFVIRQCSPVSMWKQGVPILTHIPISHRPRLRAGLAGLSLYTSAPASCHNRKHTPYICFIFSLYVACSDKFVGLERISSWRNSELFRKHLSFTAHLHTRKLDGLGAQEASTKPL